MFLYEKTENFWIAQRVILDQKTLFFLIKNNQKGILFKSTFPPHKTMPIF